MISQNFNANPASEGNIVPFTGILNDDELTCPCNNKKCFKWTCKKTYADALKSSPPDRLYRIPMTNLDVSLGCSAAFTGNIDRFQCHILDIIKEGLIPESKDPNIIKSLMDYIVERDQISKIGSTTRKGHFVNESVRNSLSVNLNRNITEKISGYLQSTIEEFLEYSNIIHEGVEIYKNHSTLSLYNGKGTKFKYHRDEHLTFPESRDNNDNIFDRHKYKWVQYSFVCCLDSNITDRLNPDKHEGCTVVYLPPYDSTKVKQFRHIKGFSCIPHVFNDTVIPNQFVAFPGGAKHCSKEILTDGAYKFILKADFRIKVYRESRESYDYHKIDGIFDSLAFTRDFDEIPNNNTFSVEELTKETVFNCNCKLCNPFRMRLFTFHQMFLSSNRLSDDLIRVIMNNYGRIIKRDYLNDYSEYYTSQRFKILTYFPRYFTEALCSKRQEYLELENEYRFDDSDTDSYNDYLEDDRFCNGDGDY